MIDFIVDVMNISNIGIVISLFLFFIMLFITSYRYYRAIYRLVYVVGKECLNCKNGHLQSPDNFFKTKIIYYNNGRKSLIKKVVPYLRIDMIDSDIQSAKVSKGTNVELDVTRRAVEIQFDYLDSRDYFVVELKHKGRINVIGRIDESGEILNTEPRGWLIFNTFLMILMLATMFYPVVNRYVNLLEAIMFFCLGLFMFIVSRYIHSLFFIPDSIIEKCLGDIK